MPLSDDAEEVFACLNAIEELALRMERERPKVWAGDGGDFFASVLTKARDIAATVRRNRGCSPRQLIAVTNMLRGCRKWFRGGEDDYDD